MLSRFTGSTQTLPAASVVTNSLRQATSLSVRRGQEHDERWRTIRSCIHREQRPGETQLFEFRAGDRLNGSYRSVQTGTVK